MICRQHAWFESSSILCPGELEADRDLIEGDIIIPSCPPALLDSSTRPTWSDGPGACWDSYRCLRAESAGVLSNREGEGVSCDRANQLVLIRDRSYAEKVSGSGDKYFGYRGNAQTLTPEMWLMREYLRRSL